MSETLSKLILHRCDKLVHKTFTRHYISDFLVPSYASGFFNLHSWALSRENQTFVHGPTAGQSYGADHE